MTKRKSLRKANRHAQAAAVDPGPELDVGTVALGDALDDRQAETAATDARNVFSSPFAALASAAVTQLFSTLSRAPAVIVVSHSPACTRSAARAAATISASIAIESRRDVLNFFNGSPW